MEELRTKLIATINDSNLPIECAYYILKDVFRELSDAYSQFLKNSSSDNEKDTEVKNE